MSVSPADLRLDRGRREKREKKGEKKKGEGGRCPLVEVGCPRKPFGRPVGRREEGREEKTPVPGRAWCLPVYVIHQGRLNAFAASLTDRAGGEGKGGGGSKTARARPPLSLHGIALFIFFLAASINGFITPASKKERGGRRGKGGGRGNRREEPVSVSSAFSAISRNFEVKFAPWASKRRGGKRKKGGKRRGPSSGLPTVSKPCSAILPSPTADH